MYNTKISTDARPAIAFLKANDLVAIPTETVYGLAGNACSEEAIRKIFLIKKRPPNNPLIVHVDAIDKIIPFVKYIPETAKLLLKQFGPGPLTVLLPGNGLLPPSVNSGRRDIAFRIPAHPLTLEVLKALEFPLVAPSANIFTTISPTTPEHVLKNFNGAIPFILNGGECNVGIESTVVGFDEQEAPIIYRQGAITAEQIQKATGKLAGNRQHSETSAPGHFPHHYSPITPMLLVDSIDDVPAHIDSLSAGILCFRQVKEGISQHQQVVLSVESDLEEAAKNLYKSLHYLDELGLKLIIAEKVPNIGLGLAINDRLHRAAYPFSET